MIPIRRTALAAIAAFLSAWYGIATARVVDGVVATVDEEPVTFSEVREAVAEAMNVPQGDADAWLREERDASRIVKWIEPLVESILVRKALAASGAEVDEKAVDGALESVRKSNGMSEAEFSEALAREGISTAAYRKRIRWQMERSSLVRARKAKEVTVTEDEVKAYWREHAERFLEGVEARFETLVIPIPESGGDPGERIIRVRLAAQQAADSLRAGRSMRETEAILREGNPGVRLVDADYLPVDDLSPELYREIRKLRAGETSPPFFTEEGARIVRLVGRRGGTAPDFAVLREALTDELADRRGEKAYSDLMAELKRAASIEIRL